MAQSVELGNLDKVVERLVKSGRYNSKSEVLREGVRLIEEREKRLALLDAALTRGVQDAVTGRVRTADDVFGSARARYSRILRDHQE